jgi:catecholate siderophore receptor
MSHTPIPLESTIPAANCSTTRRAATHRPAQTKAERKSCRGESIPATLRGDPGMLGAGALAATIAFVHVFAGSTPAHAQDQTAPAAPGAKPPPTPGALPEVVVTAPPSYTVPALSLQKYTEPLLTTPQSVTVVTSQLMKDQAVTSLRDSLRNVSGISIGAGEGSYQGDNFSIRGFAARSDIFLDGMNDFGSYNRDPFNLEQVEVLKGPSSVEFGRGSSGGVINQVSKAPELDPFIAGSSTFGTDNTRRATLDFNEPIKFLPGAAFRFNVMGDQSNVTGRGGASYSRWGFAPTLAIGLNTSTRLTLSYFQQQEDNTPDYGIPWLNDRPAPVNHNAFYGFLTDPSDYLRTFVNVGTIKLEHDFNDSITLHEQLRLASYFRSFRISQANTDDIPPGASLSKAQVSRDIIDGVSTDRDVDEDINLHFEFHTGPISHTLITGFEYMHQSVDPRRTEPTWTDVPDTSLIHPNDQQLFTGFGVTGTEVNATVDTLAAYVTDTMKWKNWSLMGGLRFDDINSNYDESITKTRITSHDALPSWRAALLYQPKPSGSIYVSSGTSVHPNIAQLALSSEPVLPPSTKDVAVGRNFEVEVGTKWDVFDRRFSLSADVFWDEQTNSAPVDLDDPLIDVNHGKERVLGFELGAVGHLTDKWQVLVNYTFQDGKVVSSSIPSMVGEPLLNVPRSTTSFWTTYDLPWKFQIGFGVNGVTRRAASEQPDPNGLVMQADGYVIYSAMLKYQMTKNVDIQLNVTNLTDEFFYDGVHPGHIVPGEGRTFFVSTNFRF